MGIIILLVLYPPPAMAVRPFVTDDARVVGKNLFLIETSMRRDDERLQNITILSYGPTEKLELAVGFTNGYLLAGEKSWQFSIAGPLAQAKYLFTEGTPNGYPGVAIVVGAGTPYGQNSFGNPSWSDFAYLALTESMGQNEQVLIHGNIGINYAKPGDSWRIATTWGIGTQIRIVGGLNYVGEIYYGDPYSGAEGGAFQTGGRYFISDRIQLDATIGSGLWGDKKPATFLGCGLRFIFGPLW
jgi:hypothetical protein